MKSTRQWFNRDRKPLSLKKKLSPIVSSSSAFNLIIRKASVMSSLSPPRLINTHIEHECLCLVICECYIFGLDVNPSVVFGSIYAHSERCRFFITLAHDRQVVLRIGANYFWAHYREISRIKNICMSTSRLMGRVILLFHLTILFRNHPNGKFLERVNNVD